MMLMDDLRGRLASRVQLTADGHKAYLQAVEEAFGADVDYGMLVKLYGEPSHSPEAARRYSPTECVEARKDTITGTPDPRHISTSYTERANLTMRMSMRRFTRLTNAFSKKLENHAHMVALYALWYNFVRIHKTLRVTPAMAAGIESRLWSMEDVVKMVDAHHRPKPTFTVQMRKDGGYGVNMDPNAYAPVLHIHGFATQRPMAGSVQTCFVKDLKVLSPESNVVWTMDGSSRRRTYGGRSKALRKRLTE